MKGSHKKTWLGRTKSARPLFLTLQGNMKSKIFITTALSLLVIVGVESSIIFSAEYFGFNCVFFVVCPVVFLISILFWMHKVTSIKCMACGKNYGVSVGFDGWPSIPNSCASCKGKG